MSDFVPHHGSNADPLVTKARAVPGTITTAGAAVVITRPNNATAYTIGDVVADGTSNDGRLHFGPVVAPATGVSGATYYLSSMNLQLQRSGANLLSTSPQFIGSLVFFTAQPATVIADNAPLALSAADRLLILTLTAAKVLSSTLNITPPSGVQNFGPAGEIEMSGTSGSVQAANDAAAVGNVQTSLPLQLWAYLYVPTPFAPTALEVFTLTPRYTWVVVPT